MTKIPTDETHLLVLFGEVRGDVKSLLRAHLDLTARLASYENNVESRFKDLEERTASLESIRFKVAGFTAAAAIFATVAATTLSDTAVGFLTLFGG